MRNHVVTFLFMFGLIISSLSFAGSCGGDRDINTCIINAKQGDSSAQYNLAVMYHRGDGISKDLGLALHWYNKAAVQGLAQAQYNLGLMYSGGDGVTQDPLKAFQWYSKAAKGGVVSAQFNLAVMYAHGEGTEKDEKKAGFWYFKAAYQGLAEAQFQLGMLYLQGLGIDQDVVKAHMYFGIAAEGGNTKAIIGQKSLAIFMSADELEKSKQLRIKLWHKTEQYQADGWTPSEP
jgi:TPR repeat protein